MKRIVFGNILWLLIIAGPVQAQTWSAYKLKGEAYRDQKKYDSAVLSFADGISSLPKDSSNSDTRIYLHTQSGNAYYAMGNYAKAEEQYLNVKEIQTKRALTATNGYAMNLNLLGQVYYYQKKNAKSEAAYHEARDTWEKLFGKESLQYAGMCNALGILYNDSGEFEKALSQHFTARAIREKLYGKENASYAQSCNNLGAVYWNLGRYDLGEPLALEAKQLRGRLTNVPKTAYAISCVNLANIYRDMGKYEQAEPLYIEARTIRDTILGKENDDYALSCDILADLYYLMHDYKKAEPLYLEAKAIRQKIGPGNYFYGQSCSNLSALYRQMGKYSESASLGLEAAKIWEKLGAPADADAAINNNNLGALYFQMDDYAQSETYLVRARKMWAKTLGESHPYYTDNSLELGRVYWKTSKLQQAKAMYEKAFASQQVQSEQMFSFTSEAEKEQYLKNISTAYNEYISFYSSLPADQQDGSPYNISLAFRNQTLASSRQLRQLIWESNDTTLTKDYELWTDYKRQLAALLAKGVESQNDRIKTIQDKANELEKSLVKRSSAFQTVRNNVTDWQAIEKKLAIDEAAVEFAEYNYFDGKRNTDSVYYSAMVIRKGMKKPQLIRLFEKRQIDSLFEKFSGSDGVNDFYTRGFKVKKDSSVSQRAYDLIWKPLEPLLKDVFTVYFAPAGALHRIAFAALPVDSATLLSEVHELVEFSTTSTVLHNQSSVVRNSDPVALYGGVYYLRDSAANEAEVRQSTPGKRSGFGYLPGTSNEVKAIAAAGKSKGFDTKVFDRSRATEMSIREWNGNASPSILHIATHGFFFDDPALNTEPITASTEGKAFRQSNNPLFRSGLLFAGANETWTGKQELPAEEDGVMTSYEVSTLYLPHTKLVVLSACETALGDIRGSEGVYGLQRAFKMAGVDYLVMSLWKVPDDETAEFMQFFYDEIFRGRPIAKAFYAAQNMMRDKYRKEPFKWAAWILLR